MYIKSKEEEENEEEEKDEDEAPAPHIRSDSLALDECSSNDVSTKESDVEMVTL